MAHKRLIFQYFDHSNELVISEKIRLNSFVAWIQIFLEKKIKAHLDLIGERIVDDQRT